MKTNWAKQANSILLLLLCAFPLFMPHWISGVAMLLLLSGFLYVFQTKQFTFQWKFFLPLAGIVFPYIIWLAASNNVALGLASVKVKLLLIAVPLVFSFSALRLNDVQVKKAFTLFCASSIIAVLSVNFLMLLKGFTHPVGFNGADFTFSYRIALEHYSGLHPTYYCAIVYMAAFIQLYNVLAKQCAHKWEFGLAFATIVVCTAGGLAGASRAPFVAFVLIVVVLLFNHIKKHAKRWWFLAAMLLGCVVLFLSPMVQNRLNEMTAKNMQAPQGNNDNGTNVRSGIFACDMALLSQHWLWGVGTGNIQQALNNCLSQYNTHVYQQFNYNTHNEYLNSWLTCGILGFMIFVGCLVYAMVKSVQSKQWLHLYFMVFMCICFLTENYLDRQIGVAFFALLQTLFFFKTLRQQ
jgi:O-antigen ligase